jgi:1-aminocyclopropane-1-carboxylate deaminase
MLRYSSTPLQRIRAPFIDAAGVELWVKREDLNHAQISGNKWWKLLHNLHEAQRQQKQTLLTFGGAFSNHIYATAAAATEWGFTSIGVIRGERAAQLSSTLQFAEAHGMRLHFVSRQAYQTKTETVFIESLRQTYGDFYCIPEGGTNHFALTGVADFAALLQRELEFDYICCPCGTGGTLAGLITGLPGRKVIGFSALKSDYLQHEVQTMLGDSPAYTNWSLLTNYHFGGYARHTPELLLFLKNFEREFFIPLEQVYTAKMFYGLFDLLKKNYFKKGSRIVALHTGGLQGRLPEKSFPNPVG